MRKIVITLCLIIAGINCFSENFPIKGKINPNVYSTIDMIKIDNDDFICEYEVENFVQNMKFSKKYTDGLLFFELSEPFSKKFNEDYYYNHKEIGETSNKLLTLIGKKTQFNSLIIFGVTDGFDDNPHCFLDDFWQGTTTYTNCSSYLTEKDKAYSVDNLSRSIMDTPWVEGVPGNGIGEGFTIERAYTDYLLIVNGYISYKKPYLYKQNGRIKKLKVTGLTSGEERILEVLDTPHPQTIDISFITKNEDIRVEIAEVYEGTKYDDTCIHLCKLYPYEVIPYEDSVK